MFRKQLHRLEELLEEAICLLKKLLERQAALAAIGVLNMKTVPVGGSALFTFTEFDAIGSVVNPSGPIQFDSDNPAVATVDNTAQILNANGSVDVPVTVVGPGKAHITGVDPASPNKVAAGDILTVTPVQAVAVSATGVLS